MSETRLRNGFIYIWYDRKRKMFYVGSHLGAKDDGYICSSRRMLITYNKRPHDFKRRIIERVSANFSSLREAEHRWLQMIKIGELGKRYYNVRRAAKGFDHAGGSKAGTSSLIILNAIKGPDGKSIHAVQAGLKVTKATHSRGGITSSAKIHADKNAEGKSVVAVRAGFTTGRLKGPDGKSIAGVKGGKARMAVKGPDGKSVFAVAHMTSLHAEKDHRGKSIFATTLLNRTHLIKNAEGKSVRSVNAGRVRSLARRLKREEIIQ